MSESAAARTPAWFLDHVRSGAATLTEALAAGPLDAQVVACPDWNVAALAKHIGGVHRWAGVCIREARMPGRDDMSAFPAFDDAAVSDWYRAAADDVIEALETIDDVTAPTWHPFPVDHVAGVWPRRMAHEIAIHRFDAEHAIGRTPAIDAELASDGIDEYFEVIVPRIVANGGELPTGSFHVHCTDVEGEWLVWTEDGEYRMIREHQKGDAALRGPAAQILLRLWNRPGPDDELSPVGDDAVLTAWTNIGGN